MNAKNKIYYTKWKNDFGMQSNKNYENINAKTKIIEHTFTYI
jgi:hypothetical protein